MCVCGGGGGGGGVLNNGLYFCVHKCNIVSNLYLTTSFFRVLYDVSVCMLGQPALIVFMFTVLVFVLYLIRSLNIFVPYCI